MVIGLSHDLEIRKFYEEEAVSQLKKVGFDAQKGLELFPQEITELDQNQDSISHLIVQHQVDAV